MISSLPALQAVLRAIQAGDLRARVEENGEPDQIEFIRAFNQMLDQLTEEQVYLENVFEAMADSLLVSNSDGTLRSCNRAACELLGYDDAELEGAPLSRVVKARPQPTGFIGLPMMSITEQLKWTSVRDYELLFSCKDGEEVPMMVNGEAIRDEDGFPVGSVVVGRDMRETLALLSEAARAEVEAERALALEQAHDKLETALHQLQAQDAIMRQDLRQARSFQQSILPKWPRDGAFRLAAIYQPAGEVGGDIYDVVIPDALTYRLFIADAPGHGVQASLRTVIIRNEYDKAKGEGNCPAETLASLNNAIAAGYQHCSMLFRAVCVDIHRESDGGASVTFANCGLPPLLHVSGANATFVFEAGEPLGEVPDVVVTSKKIHLAAGDRLFMFTDGVSGEVSPDGREFGYRNVQRVLRCDGNLEHIVGQLLLKVADHRRGAQPLDDVTVLALEA